MIFREKQARAIVAKQTSFKLHVNNIKERHQNLNTQKNFKNPKKNLETINANINSKNSHKPSY